jgi:phosphate transport system protein
MAGDLREIMTAIKIASDLERIGDLAKNIAKRSLAVHGQAGVHQAVRGIDRMSRMALEQLRGVLDAYAQRDVETALEVWRQDADLDAMYTSIFRELLTYMMEDPRAISFATHLLFAAKNVERIGDHTTNIAEMIYYLVRGELLREARPKKDSSISAAWWRESTSRRGTPCSRAVPGRSTGCWSSRPKRRAASSR